MEANDNTKYLRTLETWFQQLNGEDDFPKTVGLFKPMLHIILLIWKNSKHYNTSARLGNNNNIPFNTFSITLFTTLFNHTF